MKAHTPEEICRLFQEFVAQGNLDGVMSLYEREAVFLNESRRQFDGHESIRLELAGLVQARVRLQYAIRQVVQAGDLALMHTDWTTESSEGKPLYAIEVARRQPDGTWRWLIGDPYSVGRRTSG